MNNIFAQPNSTDPEMFFVNETHNLPMICDAVSAYILDQTTASAQRYIDSFGRAVVRSCRDLTMQQFLEFAVEQLGYEPSNYDYTDLTVDNTYNYTSIKWDREINFAPIPYIGFIAQIQTDTSTDVRDGYGSPVVVHAPKYDVHGEARGETIPPELRIGYSVVGFGVEYFVLEAMSSAAFPSFTEFLKNMIELKLTESVVGIEVMTRYHDGKLSFDMVISGTVDGEPSTICRTIKAVVIND